MAENNASESWVREIHQGNVGLSFKVSKTLFSGKSPFQQIDIVETEGLGRMLLNDGSFMLSEKDEFVYHEMIAHVPMFVHPSPERVLIIGGGDGGTAREVLRHDIVERAVLVEIDEMVVNACKEHIPSVSHALNNPKLEIRIEDGVKFAARTKEIFDVIIVDSTDPVGPAAPLFDAGFYENARRILAKDGILISQAESPYYDCDIQHSMFSNQRQFFEKLHQYLFSNLTYPGGLWWLGFASKGLCPIKDFDPERVKASGMDFRYYNAEIHRAAFVLPTFVSRNLKGVIDPL